MADDNKQVPSVPQPSQDDNGQAQTPQQVKQAADYQAMYSQGGKFKEQVEAVAAGMGGGEAKSEGPVETVSEVPTVPEVEKKPELAGYIEKVEREEQITPVVDDYTGQVLMKPVEDSDVTVTLPLTQDQVQQGLHHMVWDSVRWLAEWCVRQLKMLHGKVRYKDSTKD